MGNTRTNDDGFKGEYPAPLNWGRIEQKIRETTDTEQPSGD